MPFQYNTQRRTTIDTNFVNDILNIADPLLYTTGAPQALGPTGPTGAAGLSITGPTGAGPTGPTGSTSTAPTGPTGAAFVAAPVIRITIDAEPVTTGTTTLFTNTPDFDTFNYWSNGVFNPKIAGVYTVAVSVFVDCTDYGDSYFQVLKNAAPYIEFGHFKAGFPILGTSPIVTDAVFMNGTTDTISIACIATGDLDITGTCTIF